MFFAKRPQNKHLQIFGYSIIWSRGVKSWAGSYFTMRMKKISAPLGRRTLIKMSASGMR